MKIQYISDNEGNTTAVVIPIDQWNQLKAKHADIEEAENDYDLPEAAKAILDERMATENKANAIAMEDAQKIWRKNMAYKVSLYQKHMMILRMHLNTMLNKAACKPL